MWVNLQDRWRGDRWQQQKQREQAEMAGSMGMWELAVWSAMAGAVAVVCLVLLADCLLQRTLASVRGLSYVSMMGGAAIVMSGLPGQLWPALGSAVWWPLQATVGPLSGALALVYLGTWLDAGRSEGWLRRALWVGSCLLVSVALAGWVVWDDGLRVQQVLMVSGLVSVFMVLLALVASVRAAMLGDRLARWMVVACACLGVAVVGLNAKSLALPGLGVWFWSLTALFTVAYFLIVIALTIQRTREVKRLKELADGLEAPHLNVPVPQGPSLIPRVADAMWRSQRMERPCMVAALVVRNLYELGEQAEHGYEVQILAVLATRICRHVGFRNVVGLYHPRCFVLAVSSGQDPRRGELMVETLLQSVCERVRVGSSDRSFDFWPTVGLGLVNVTSSAMDALGAIDLAEQLALESPPRDDPRASHATGETPPPVW